VLKGALSVTQSPAEELKGALQEAVLELFGAVPLYLASI